VLTLGDDLLEVSSAQVERRALPEPRSKILHAIRHTVEHRHCTPHVLRHSTATALIRAGNGIEVVADVLAHASLDTTRHYVHLVGDQVHAAVASLAEPPRRQAAR
jgi:site-specific recombinase XerD